MVRKVKRMFPHVEIALSEKAKEGYFDTPNKITINPSLKTAKFSEVLSHELLHYIGLDHGHRTRRLGYRSYGRKQDRLSQKFAKILFN